MSDVMPVRLRLSGFAERLERGSSARVMETLGPITVGEAAQLLIGKRYRGCAAPWP